MTLMQRLNDVVVTSGELGSQYQGNVGSRVSWTKGLDLLALPRMFIILVHHVVLIFC